MPRHRREALKLFESTIKARKDREEKGDDYAEKPVSPKSYCTGSPCLA
jgi:hypothetical protein